jgi:hypothetical protein
VRVSVRSVVDRLGFLPKWYLLIGALAAISVGLWFRGPYTIYYIDNFVPLNPLRDFPHYTSAWNDLFNTGGTNGTNLFLEPFLAYYSGLQLLGSPLWLSQLLLYFGLFAGSGCGMYALVKSCLRKYIPSPRCELAAMAAATFYMFNPFNAFFTWDDGMPFLGLMMAGIPLLLLAVIALMSTPWTLRAPRFVMWFGILVLSAYVTFLANVPYVVSVILLVAGTCIVAITLNLRPHSALVSRLVKSVGIFAVILGVNSWWLLPEYLVSSSPIYQSASGVTLASNVVGFHAVTSVASLFQVLMFGGIVNAYSTSQEFNSLYQGSSPFLLLGLIVPVALGMSLLSLRAQAPRLQSAYLFVALGLLVVWLLLANVGPGYAWEAGAVPSSPFFSPLVRNPYAAFGALYATLGALAIAGGVAFPQLGGLAHKGEVAAPRRGVFTSARYWRRKNGSARSATVIAIAVVVLSVAYSFPLLTGYMLPENLLGAGGFPARVQVPGYESELADYLEAHSGSFRDLVYPPGITLVHQSWPHGYVGGNALSYLTGVPTIVSYGSTVGTTQASLPALTYFSTEEQAPGSIGNLLSMLSVRYVVVDPTISSVYTNVFNSSSAASFLSNQSSLSSEGSFGPTTVYSVSNPLAGVSAMGSVVSPQLVPIGSTTNLTPELCSDLWSNESVVSDLLESRVGSVRCNSDGSLTATYDRPPGGVDNGTDLPFPGYPILVNAVPLNITAGVGGLGHTVVVNLTTTPGTGVSVYVSNDTALNRANFFTGALTSGLDYGASFASAGTASLGEYTGNATIALNLQDVNGFPSPWPVSFSTLNYLIFDIHPDRDGVRIPFEEMGNNISITLHSVQVENEEWNFMDPSFPLNSTLVVSNETALAAVARAGHLSMPTITWRMDDASEYDVMVSNATGPFLVNLAQTYDPLWTANLPDSAGRVLLHFEGDLYMNSWLVLPSEKNFRLTLAYSPNALVTSVTIIAIALPILGFGAAAVPLWILLGKRANALLQKIPRERASQPGRVQHRVRASDSTR